MIADEQMGLFDFRESLPCPTLSGEGVCKAEDCDNGMPLILREPQDGGVTPQDGGAVPLMVERGGTAAERACRLLEVGMMVRFGLAVYVDGVRCGIEQVVGVIYNKLADRVCVMTPDGRRHRCYANCVEVDSR